MARLQVPVLAFALVLGMATFLIVGIILKPWASLDQGPRTHLNLGVVPPQGYARTAPSFVGEEAPLGWRAHQGSHHPEHDPEADPGQALFIAYGCASCHGLKGQGTRWAPMEVESAEYVPFMARTGPGGMPVYPESYLPDDKLDLIAAWLVAQATQREPKPTLTPTPVPATPTPTAVASAEPIAIPSGTTPTPTPEAPPESQATPTATPLPVVPKGDASRGAALFAEKKCANCHGKGGKGTALASALNTTEFAQAYPDDASIVQVMRGGKGDMPPYDSSRLTDQELLDIIAYLRSLSPQ